MEPTQKDTGIEEISENEFLKVKDHIEEVDVSEIFGKETKADKEPELKEENEDPKKEEKLTSLGDLVKASFALNLVNIIVPVLIVLGFKLARYKVSKKEFLLTAQEIKVLEDPLQKYLDYIKINLNNPLYNLMLAVSIVYGAKVIEASEKAEKFNKTSKEVKEAKKEEMKSAEQTLEEIANYEEWAEGYTEEQKVLIRATRKKRNRSYEDAIEWLTKKNQL